MIVSSPGGHLESGDAIHDVVRFISAPVNMIGTGWVGSAGGPASDVAIQAREIVKARERIARVIARESGQALERVLADIEVTTGCRRKKRLPMVWSRASSSGVGNWPKACSSVGRAVGPLVRR
jgi:ATP-dependent protease ClpP protease subunit